MATQPPKRTVRKAFRAAAKGDTAALEALVADSPELVAAMRGDGATLLHEACVAGQCEALRFLVDHGAALEARKDKYKTALHEAATHGHAACVDVLIAAGAAVDSHKTNGWTPLMYAAKGGHSACVDRLLADGADVHQVNREGATPLYLAARAGHPACVERLLGADAAVDAPTHNRRTPLFSAVDNRHFDVVEQLLAAGASAAVADSRGFTLWHLCAEQADGEGMRALHTRGLPPAVAARDVMGRTPLHVAAQAGNEGGVAFLLDASVAQPAAVDAVDGDGCTPLYAAVARGSAAVVRLLLARGADPSLACIRRAPLHMAVMLRDEAARRTCTQLLLSAGARTDAKDQDGRTVESLAAERGVPLS